MEQPKRVKIRKRVRKRRAWTDRAWVRASFVVIVIAAMSVAVTLFIIGKLPGLEAFTGGDRAAHNNSDQNATPAPSANDTPSAAASEGASPSQSERNVAQENLHAAVFAKGVKVVNEGDTPIHLTRVVRNKRYGIAWCDTSADVNTDPNQPPNFANKVDQVLQIGDSYNILSYPVCGTAGVVEVYTDQGNAAFRL